MAFIKQPDDFSCGPVAIVNVLKWLGRKVGHRYLPKLRTLCGTTKDGTIPYNFALTLIREVSDFGSVRKVKPSIRTLDSHLSKGGIVVIGYNYSVGKSEDAHYVVCTKKSKRGYYTLVNETSHRSFKDNLPTLTKRKRNTIRKMLAKKSQGYPAEMWLIGKRDGLA